MNEIIKKKQRQEKNGIKPGTLGGQFPRTSSSPPLFYSPVATLRASSEPCSRFWDNPNPSEVSAGLWSQTVRAYESQIRRLGSAGSTKKVGPPPSQSSHLNSPLTCTSRVSILMAQRRIDRTEPGSIHRFCTLGKAGLEGMDEPLEPPGPSPLVELYFEFVPKRS